MTIPDYRLDPQIRTRLRQFARRRRRLILLRGTCATIFSLLAAMLLVVVADWLFLLPDGLRLALSFGGYALVLCVAWLSCGRWMVRILSERQLARFVEAEVPHLREDLVSAVELGAPAADARYDSPVFRSLLQRRVAHEVQRLRVGRLLPWKRVSTWSLAAATLIGACLALSRLPDVQFAHRFRRALLPMANLERLSRVQVSILQPTGGDVIVPHGESVAILASLTGPPIKRITLETRTASGSPQRIEMQHEADRRFSATVRVAEDCVAWRVFAGDAVTRFFHIQTRPRPYATEFEKVYEYPPYAGLPSRRLEEKHGDLQALEGTHAKIVIRPDQPIARGHLLLRFGQQEEQVPLQAVGDGRLAAELTIAQTGTYQVQLVAAETGFDSRFAPRYQITAQPDVAPAVQITQPRGSLLVTSDEIVTLIGFARDELPLAGVEQWVQVNGGEWLRETLSDVAAERVDIRRDWDLLELKLLGGDQVQTKLVATDRKGQVSESAPLRITVQPGGLDGRGMALLAAKQKAAQALQRFREVANAQGQRGKESLKILRDKEPGPAERQLHAAQALQAAERIAAEAPVARSAVLEAIRLVDAGTDAYDLALGGLAVLPVEHRLARKVTYHVYQAQRATDEKDRQRELDRARETFERALGYVSEAERWLAAAAATDALAVCLEDWHNLIAQQRRAVPGEGQLPDSEAAWKMLVRRQAAVGAACELLDNRLRPTLERLGGRVHEALQSIAQARRAQEPLLKETPPTAKLVDSAHRLTRTLRTGRSSAQPAFRESADRLGKSRPNVHGAAVGSAARQLSGVSSAVQTLFPPRSEPSPEVEAARHELTAAEWPALIGVLRGMARVEETRHGADHQYVADLDATARAANALLARIVPVTAAAADGESSYDPRRQWTELVESAAVLETQHNLGELILTVQRIAAQEKWFAADPRLDTRQVYEWDFVGERLVPIGDALAAHAGNRAVKEVIDGLKRLAQAPSALAVTQELERRAVTADERSAIQEQLVLVEEELQAIRRLLSPEVEKSRQSVGSMAPSISEALRELAEETRQQEQQTATLARQAADADAAETQPAAQQQRDQHRALSGELQQVLDTLRRLAHLQNPLDPQQRELIRDIDTATAMLQDQAAAIADALRNAAQAAAAADQSGNLAQAADSQQQLAHSLDELADHFERALAGEDVAASRAALREAEQQFARDPSLDAMQQSLEQLAALGQLSPQALLEQLERELQQNRPMQRELDDITRQTLQQAQLDLQQGARAERDYADELELADSETMKAADPLIAQLQRIAQRSRELADQEIPSLAKDGRTATGGRLDEPLNLAASDLRAASEQAGQAADPQLSATARMRRAAPLAQVLDEAADDLDEAALRAGGVKKQMDAKRTAHQTATVDVEAARQSVAEMTQKSAEAQRQAQRSADERQRKRREAETLQNQATQAARQAATNNQDATVARAAAEAKQRADAGQEAVRAADRDVQQTEAAANQARQAARTAQQQLETAQRRLRSAQPPTAQEVQRETGAEEIRGRVERTAADVRQLAEEVRKIREAADQLARAAKPSRDALQQVADQQTPLAENVARTSRDLARAARHEQRLQNQPAGEAIERLAEAVSDTAREDLPEVAEQVRQQSTANDARASLEQAAGTLDQEAESIDTLLGAEVARQSGASPAADPPSPAGKSPENAISSGAETVPGGGRRAAAQDAPLADPQTARWLARTLDSLDRLLFDGNSGPPPAEASPPTNSEAAAALAAALQAQAQSLQAARTAAAEGLPAQPGSEPTSQARSLATMGAAVEAGEIAVGDLPAARSQDNVDWGRLPPNQMRDLIEGRREAVSEEYRRMVEAYYRVLAEKAGGARTP